MIYYSMYNQIKYLKRNTNTHCTILTIKHNNKTL